jgi:hypothetical protein
MGSSTHHQSPTTPEGSPGPRIFQLDPNAIGAIQTINNIVNMTVVSKDPNDLRAEYRAGFVQGKLQGNTIISARDNSWDNAYLTDPGHTFPKQPGPTKDELGKACGLLMKNYIHFLQYVAAPSTKPVLALRLKRLLFRMLGIYHGVTVEDPANLDFSGHWLPDQRYFKQSELVLGYEATTLTFMDVYFLNAYNDLMDVIATPPEVALGAKRASDFPDKCSAFLKRCDDEIILTHNTWSGFLSQTMNQTIAVNGDWITENASNPGLIGSGTDFGYNNKGLMFNETTHRLNQTQTKTEGLWIFWRAALAEQFSSSIPEFFDAISLDDTGTYLNGYMLVDAKTKETGLVEMSYRCFLFYRSTGGKYTVTSKCLDQGECSLAYDAEMVNARHLMGINFPASVQVKTDLDSTDNRPARRKQFNRLLPTVKTVDDAKRVITYTDDPGNPLSIFGRWDVGYGETDFPKQIPDGSIDAKVASSSMVLAFMKLSGVFDPASLAKGYHMLFGTPLLRGKPFVWSQSSWSWQKLRDVPDRVDGSFTLMPLYMK